MAKCDSCNSRKGKRNCPALAGSICSQCCGSKQEVEINCPKDCFYLAKAKQYLTERQNAKNMLDFEREMNSVIRNEEPHLDVLQNIEFVISAVSQDRGDISDRHVEAALECLMELGKAQLDLPSKFLTTLPPNIQAVVDAVDDVLKLRESHGAKEDLTTRLKCIYRILDSVRTHRNSHDQRSYLRFASAFVA